MQKSATAVATGLGVWLAATPALAFPPVFPTSVHNILVLLHVFGAIIFMGNLVVTAMWMANAKKTRNAAVLHYASRMVIRADWLLTLPGAVLLVTSGILALGLWGGFGKAAWAELSLALFILSALIWLARLIPLQRRMAQITREAVELNIALSDHFYVVHGRWMMWGGFATLLPLIALYFMVYKPALWGG